MEKSNVLSNTRSLTGAIEMTSPPTVSDSYDSSNPNSKPFFLKICGDIGDVSGSFVVNDVQCKIVNGHLVPDISVHEDSKFFYNSTANIIEPNLIYIWDNKNKIWFDAATTTNIIEKRSKARITWLVCSKKLEKTFKFSKAESRKCFRTLRLAGVEELVRWLNFFKETSPSKDFVAQVLKFVNSKKEISELFEFECKDVEAAKKAMEHYIKTES